MNWPAAQARVAPRFAVIPSLALRPGIGESKSLACVSGWYWAAGRFSPPFVVSSVATLLGATACLSGRTHAHGLGKPPVAPNLAPPAVWRRKRLLSTPA
jgi:hypothetical protein